MGRLTCLGPSSLIVIQDGSCLREEMSSVPGSVLSVCQRTEGAEVLLGFLEVL